MLNVRSWRHGPNLPTCIIKWMCLRWNILRQDENMSLCSEAWAMFSSLSLDFPLVSVVSERPCLFALSLALLSAIHYFFCQQYKMHRCSYYKFHLIDFWASSQSVTCMSVWCLIVSVKLWTDAGLIWLMVEYSPWTAFTLNLLYSSEVCNWLITHKRKRATS